MLFRSNIQNKPFTTALGKALQRPTFFWVPKTILRLALGEFHKEITEGQQVISSRLPQTGFKFQYSTIDEALNQILKRKSHLNDT